METKRKEKEPFSLFLLSLGRKERVLIFLCFGVSKLARKEREPIGFQGSLGVLILFIYIGKVVSKRGEERQKEQGRWGYLPSRKGNPRDPSFIFIFFCCFVRLIFTMNCKVIFS